VSRQIKLSENRFGEALCAEVDSQGLWFSIEGPEQRCINFPREARSVGGRELRALPDTLTVEEVAELLRSQAVTRLTSGRKLGDPEPLPESGLIYCVGILADPQEEEAGA